MNQLYNPTDLFDIETECIIYKNKNSVNNMEYNQGEHQGVLHSKTSVPFVTFPELTKFDFIKHGFSTKLGGVSSDQFSTLNLSFSRGDDEEKVRENYNRILKSMELQQTHAIFSDQVHDTKVYRVTKKDIPTDNPYERKLVGIDGLITNEPNLTLITSYADCVPLFFVDPVKKAIGLSHSGWKGTVGKIGKKTVEAMTKEFGSDPKDIIAVIGPSICFDCYEISKDVADEFCMEFQKNETDLFLYDKGNGKYQLDLWLANEIILKEAGILTSNMSNSNICTCCNNRLFYSHRASKGMRGNLAAFLSIVS